MKYKKVVESIHDTYYLFHKFTQKRYFIYFMHDSFNHRVHNKHNYNIQ